MKKPEGYEMDHLCIPRNRIMGGEKDELSGIFRGVFIYFSQKKTLPFHMV